MPNWCSNKLVLTELVAGALDGFLNMLKPDDIFWGNPHFTSYTNFGLFLNSGILTEDDMKDKEMVGFIKEYELRERKQVVLLSSFIRPPDDVVVKGYSSCGYNWCIDNWGTKWDVEIDKEDEIDIRSSSDGMRSATIYFDTPWSPPMWWFLKIADMFHGLKMRISYYETGDGFAGSMEFDIETRDIVISSIESNNVEEYNEFTLNEFNVTAIRGESEEDE